MNSTRMICKAKHKRQLEARFDRLFTTTTGFATFDRLVARLHANKQELLLALKRPDIPLHTNGSENDIRCQVIKRKISGGTRSDLGRDCRGAFLGLMKTCDKLGVSCWEYLGSRLDIPGAPTIPSLPDLIRKRLTARGFAPVTKSQRTVSRIRRVGLRAGRRKSKDDWRPLYGGRGCSGARSESCHSHGLDGAWNAGCVAPVQ